MQKQTDPCIVFFLSFTGDSRSPAIVTERRSNSDARALESRGSSRLSIMVSELMSARVGGSKSSPKRSERNLMLLNERAHYQANHREAPRGNATRLKTRQCRCRWRQRIKTQKIWCSISKLALKAACLLWGFMAKL